MRLLILGGTGMLGSQLVKYFSQQAGIELCWSCRSFARADAVQNNAARKQAKAQVSIMRLEATVPWSIPSADMVINAIGIIKPRVQQDVANTIHVNALFPHELARVCEDECIPLIHVTTDCVFSGEVGGYTEESVHDDCSLYGRSKSLGEPSNKAMVLRTSIIGREVGSSYSLVEWLVNAASKKSQNIVGYTNHQWNGITTLQFAKCCKKIIEEGLYRVGCFHVYSPRSVSKAILLRMLLAELGLHREVQFEPALHKVNRVLFSNKSLVSQLNIPDLRTQIKDMVCSQL